MNNQPFLLHKLRIIFFTTNVTLNNNNYFLYFYSCMFLILFTFSVQYNYCCFERTLSPPPLSLFNLEVCNFKKETPARVFSWQFYKIYRNRRPPRTLCRLLLLDSNRNYQKEQKLPMTAMTVEEKIFHC